MRLADFLAAERSGGPARCVPDGAFWRAQDVAPPRNACPPRDASRLSRSAPRRCRSVLLGWLLVLNAAAGCASRSRPPALPPLLPEEVPRLLEETAAVGSSIRRYQAVMGVRGEGRGGRFSGRLLVVFEREGTSAPPDAVAALRMEAYGPVGGSRWTLVAAPQRVTAVVRARQAFAEGRTLSPFVRELLGAPLGMEEVAALLVGTGVPVPPAAAARPGPEGVSVQLPQGARIWWSRDPASGKPRVERAAAAAWQVRYPENQPLRKGRVPRRIEIVTARISAAFTVEELRLNAALHPDSFVVQVPPGFRQVPAASLAGTSWRSER